MKHIIACLLILATCTYCLSLNHLKIQVEPCCNKTMYEYNTEKQVCECNAKNFFFQTRNQTNCQLCKSPKLWVNFECLTCLSPRVWEGINCVCPQPRKWNGSSCECSGGRIWNGKQCVCSLPKIWNGYICSCPANQQWQNNNCVCPSPQIWNGKKCVFTINSCKSGLCSCPKNKILKKNECVCPQGQFQNRKGECEICAGSWGFKSKKCYTCDNLTEIFDPTTQSCICNNEYPYRNYKGKCQKCQNPGEWNKVSKFCNCKFNFVWLDTTEKCQCLLPNKLDKNGNCGNCTPPQLYNPYLDSCFCPIQLKYQYEDGTCHSCPEHKKYFYNGVCNKCPKENPHCEQCVIPTIPNLPSPQTLPNAPNPSKTSKKSNIRTPPIHSLSKCPLNKPHSYGGKCHQCPQAQPFFYEYKCHNCPQQAKYYYKQMCNICRQGNRFQDGECKCLEGMDYQNGSCFLCKELGLVWDNSRKQCVRKRKD